jgi:hypothetical protein
MSKEELERCLNRTREVTRARYCKWEMNKIHESGDKNEDTSLMDSIHEKVCEQQGRDEEIKQDQK